MYVKYFDKNEKVAKEELHEVVPCSQQDKLEEKFDDYFWPESWNYTIEGTFLNDQYQMVGFAVDKWENSDSTLCADDSLINEKLNQLRMKVIYK